MVQKNLLKFTRIRRNLKKADFGFLESDSKIHKRTNSRIFASHSRIFRILKGTLISFYFLRV